MKRYSIYHVPVLSFFSKDLYRDVALHWRGTGFAYLLLLLAISWIPLTVMFHRALVEFVDNEAPELISQIPTITIVDGEASIEEPQPYYIKDPETGETFVVIDTTGSITSLRDIEAIGLVTKTKAEIKENDFETRTYYFSEIDDFTLDQETIKSWLDMAKKFLVPVFYPLAVLGSFVYTIIQLLICAAIGLLFASWCKAEMSYKSLLRLSVIAATPPIIIETVIDMNYITVPFAGWLYFLCILAYLFFGVKAASEEEGPTTELT